MLERLRGYLRERGYAVDEVDAVLAQRRARIDLVVPRSSRRCAPSARCPRRRAWPRPTSASRNILKKADKAQRRGSTRRCSPSAEEQALHGAIAELRAAVRSAPGRRATTPRRCACSRASAPQVDTFFDEGAW